MITKQQYQKEKDNIIDTRLSLIAEVFDGWRRGEITDSEVKKIFSKLNVDVKEAESIYTNYKNNLPEIYGNDKRIEAIRKIKTELQNYPQTLSVRRLQLGLDEVLNSYLTTVKEREIRSDFIEDVDYNSAGTISASEKESIKTCIKDLKAASFYAKLAEMEDSLSDVDEKDRKMQAIDRIVYDNRHKNSSKDSDGVRVKDYIDAEKEMVSGLIDRDADGILKNSNNVRLACDFFIRQQELANQLIKKGKFNFSDKDVYRLSEENYHPAKY